MSEPAAREPAAYVTGALAELAAHADRVALVKGDRRFTFAEALDQTFRIARALRAHGIERGDGVVFVGANPPEIVFTSLAAQILGARFTPVHVTDTTPVGQVEHILTDADPRAIVIDLRGGLVDSAFATSARRCRAARKFSLGPDRQGGLVDLLAEAAEQPGDPVAVAARDDDIARLHYTGGTTGLPKGVGYTFAALSAAAAARGSASPVSLTFLAVSPMAHAAGAIALGLLRAGARVELFDHFDAAQFLDAVRRAGERGDGVATYLYPPMLYELLDHPDTARADLRPLRSIIYGSAPSSPARVAEAVRRFGPVLAQSYAQTEAIAIAGLTPEDHRRAVEGDRPDLLSSVGRALPGVSVRALGPDGRCVRAGEVGEICVSGPTVMNGYWRRPELTRQVLVDGLLHTGDVGYVDDAGYVHLVGRREEVVVVDDRPCYPKPIEDALSCLPGVRQAAVLAVPDDHRGDVLVAVLQADGSVTPESAHRWLVDRLDGTPAPARIELIRRMPTTTFGKPDKRALRARLSHPARGI